MKVRETRNGSSQKRITDDSQDVKELLQNRLRIFQMFNEDWRLATSANTRDSFRLFWKWWQTAEGAPYLFIRKRHSCSAHQSGWYLRLLAIGLTIHDISISIPHMSVFSLLQSHTDEWQRSFGKDHRWYTIDTFLESTFSFDTFVARCATINDSILQRYDNRLLKIDVPYPLVLGMGTTRGFPGSSLYQKCTCVYLSLHEVATGVQNNSEWQQRERETESFTLDTGSSIGKMLLLDVWSRRRRFDRNAH